MGTTTDRAITVVVLQTARAYTLGTATDRAITVVVLQTTRAYTKMRPYPSNGNPVSASTATEAWSFFFDFFSFFFAGLDFELAWPFGVCSVELLLCPPTALSTIVGDALACERLSER